MSVDQQFNAIGDKLQLLLKAVARLQKENERLKTDLQGAHEREQAAYQQVEELQQQAAILKYAAGDMSDKEKKDFERKINQYLREIDKCITYLSK